MPLPGRVAPPFFLSLLPASRFDYVGQKRKNAKLQNYKITKTQRFNCKTLIFNDIGFCIFVKSCKTPPNSPKKGVFSGKIKPFEAQNPPHCGGFLCFLALAVSLLITQ
ncbi:MAG: hypothetical protein UHS50_01275 [Bacteroidaceae bacterium]|nr:hypothetical protein [Bacteroidaceae bacterium]